MQNSPQEPQPNLPVPPLPSLPYTMNGGWFPQPGARRMSKARFRLRARIWRKAWFKWLGEHKLSWLMPLILNVVAILCLLTDSIGGIILSLLLCIAAEIALLIFLFRSLSFTLKNQFHNDTKMRMRDLGIPPGPIMFLSIVGGACVGIGTEFGNAMPIVGLVLLLLVIIIVPLLMYYKEGAAQPNSYGPPPDDAPTEEELATAGKSA